MAGYDYEALGKYSDFVVLIYDTNPASPDPQAGIDWVEQVVDYAIARIPAQKVVLGIGYYGYDWYNGGRNSVIPVNNKMTYSGIVFADELSQKYGLKLHIDEKSGMSYGTYIDESGRQHQVWMENDYLVDLKAKLVIRKGLKGIALWRLGYSTPGFWKAVENNFIRIGSKPKAKGALLVGGWAWLAIISLQGTKYDIKNTIYSLRDMVKARCWSCRL